MSEIQKEFEALPFRSDADLWDVLDTGDEAADLAFGRECARRIATWLKNGGDIAVALHVMWLATGGEDSFNGPKTTVAKGFLEEIRARWIRG